MNKNILIIFIILNFLSCGSIKSSFSSEPFTVEEISLFQSALSKYKLDDHSGELQITGETSDYLLLINANYPAPYSSSSFEYRFTKEDSIFICRSYRNNEIVERKENKDFRILLEQVLGITGF